MVLNNPLFVARNSRSSGFQIEQSLRFESSAYLYRSPSSAGNQNVWTISLWAKRGQLGSQQDMYSAGTGGTDILYWTSNDQIAVDAPALSVLVSNDRFRDPSAWYHIVMAVDATNGTNSNRTRIYVNNREITSWDTDGRGSLTSNKYLTNSTTRHTLGIRSSNLSSTPYKGYESEFYLIDGQQLTPSDFGEYDDNGVWRPKAYTGTYGTNGVHLTFDSAGIGNDSGTNGHNWSHTGFTTSGAGTDVMSDTPTTNYGTFNPAWPSGLALSEGNLSVSFTNSASEAVSVPVTMGATSGKVYVEFKYTASGSGGSCGVGVLDLDTAAEAELAGYESGWTRIIYDQRGVARKDNTNYAVNLATTNTAGDILGIAVDCDNGEVRFYVNGTLQYTGTGLSYGRYGFHFEPNIGGSSNTCTVAFNGGQRAFEQTVPTGYKALNSSNLRAPDISDGSQNMQTVLWTGTGTARTQTGYNFQPDLLWIMNRSNSGMNVRLFDVVRGDNGTVMYRLGTNDTANEDVDNDVTGLTSTGFTLGNDGTDHPNVSGHSYVGWGWKAGQSSGSSISTGSIDGTNPTIASTVSVNQSAGFSIVSYNAGLTSSGTKTIAHGLGVAPKLIIGKTRSSGAWRIRPFFLNNNAYDYLEFDYGTLAQLNSSDGTMSVPTSTTFDVNWNTSVGASGNIIAYCFAEVEGFSKFGKYERNGSSDGPYIHLGFTPALILIKEYAAGTEQWALYDNKRPGYNTNDTPLFPDSTLSESYIESTYTNEIDFLSNGFKLRNSDSRYNSSLSSYRYLYAAWAANPFGGNGVSPATAQ